MAEKVITKKQKKPKKEARAGCFTESMMRFLNIPMEKRKEVYGKNTAKYYERVVKSIKESFGDHRLALGRLPPEYLKKIDFMPSYDYMLGEIIKLKLEKEDPRDVLNSARKYLRGIQSHIYYKQVQDVAGPSFSSVLYWLDLLIKHKEYLEHHKDF
ncbi:MAG: hypothetical protein AUF74_00075 [Thaumarchaeota archaeon 13_1_20CM_2_38_5]|nr:MAG: hypothetical protein AUF74_00075 [Thaumarchaeota archaeon 13_1_20CM_2_38_5]